MFYYFIPADAELEDLIKSLPAVGSLPDGFKMASLDFEKVSRYTYLCLAHLKWVYR